MKKSLRAQWVLGYADGDHRLLHDAEVVYENDSIIFVGHNYPGQVDERVDCGEALLSPGFVDMDALGDVYYGLLDWETRPNAPSPFCGRASITTAAASCSPPRRRRGNPSTPMSS